MVVACGVTFMRTSEFRAQPGCIKAQRENLSHSSNSGKFETNEKLEVTVLSDQNVENRR